MLKEIAKARAEFNAMMIAGLSAEGLRTRRSMACSQMKANMTDTRASAKTA